MTPRAALRQAIAAFGSQMALGQAIGFSQNGVHQALKHGRISPRMASKIEAVTNGTVLAVDLCPDAFGSKRQVLAKKWNGEPMRRAS